MRLMRAAEAGGISKGGLPTAAEDMDGTMMDCGGGGTGAGKGAHVKDSKK